MLNTIAILIPAYNPGEPLSDLVASLSEYGFRKIVIVDDGSKDSSVFDKTSMRAPVHVLRHSQNLGKGAALKTGFSFISEKLSDGLKTIITVDADGQHLYSDVIRISENAREHSDKLILGVRDFSESVPIKSALGNQLTKLVLRRAENISLSDTQTGLRAIPIGVAQESCGIPSNRYEFELESILLANRLGTEIKEVPITTVYIANNESSHFRPIVDSMRVYAVFARFLSVSLVSFIIDIAAFAACFAISSNVYTSTYLARSISATLNFLGNKYFVFKSQDRVRAIFEAAGYVTLVLIMATLSAYFVNLVQSKTLLNIIAIKILVDASLFFISFFAQKYLLFFKK